LRYYGPYKQTPPEAGFGRHRACAKGMRVRRELEGLVAYGLATHRHNGSADDRKPAGPHSPSPATRSSERQRGGLVNYPVSRRLVRRLLIELLMSYAGRTARTIQISSANSASIRGAAN
jgi:hypothetical protein